MPTSHVLSLSWLSSEFSIMSNMQRLVTIASTLFAIMTTMPTSSKFITANGAMSPQILTDSGVKGSSLNIHRLRAMSEKWSSTKASKDEPVGLITIVNPSKQLFPDFCSESEDEMTAFDDDNAESCVVISTPGANVVPVSTADDEENEDSSESVTFSKATSGYGCAAACMSAGVTVVNGFEATDIDLSATSWKNTRLGRSISCIFAAHIAQSASGESRKKPMIILGVNEAVTSIKVQQAVLTGVEELYQEVVETAKAVGSVEGNVPSSLEDAYDVRIAQIDSPDDVASVMALAREEAPSRTSTPPNVAAIMTEIFNGNNKLLESVLASPSEVIDSILRCDGAYARQARTVRTKLTLWKARVARGLVVDRFGSQATSLFLAALKNYDDETIEACGGPAAGYRLQQRAKLQSMLKDGIDSLFLKQVGVCEKNALQTLQRSLLRLRKSEADKALSSDGGDADAKVAKGYDDNAAAVRAAAFAFDTSAGDLEVPPLNLSKERYSEEMSGKLHEALNKFADSPAAQLQDMKRISKAASRQAKIKKSQKGNEPSIDLGVALVAMFRPDGYGNLSGFAGYNLGPHSITVGIQNDADSPETISQFGGVRPPFLRVQPKLDVNVEL